MHFLVILLLYCLCCERIRAVVWTDTIQFFMMFGAVFAVIILGFLNLQNPTELLQIAERGERLIWFEYVLQEIPASID